MSSRLFDSEVEMARVVVSWLQSMRWEVFQEVQPRRSGSTCDIVARRDGITWAIETKLSFGPPVVEQAWRWVGEANYSSCATPARSRSSSGRAVLGAFCRDRGIGHLEVRPPTEFSEGVSEAIRPRLSRKTSSAFRHLREEHKTFAEAGNAEGRRFTPWKATCLEVTRFVHQNPGATLKEVVDGVDHHYRTSSTARSSLAKWIRLGVIPGVRLSVEGGKARVYPERAAA